jgi:GH25 family lysozyme M1 (1,4-beta-N-acetylmuramidase)
MSHHVEIPGRNRARTPIVATLVAGVTVVAATTALVLHGGGGTGSAAASPTELPAATRSVGQEAVAARHRLAANLARPHAGRPEALTHAATDALGSSWPQGAIDYPRRVVSDQSSEPLGVDVSDHQADVDWAAVAADGYAFAMIKATEGTYYVDSAYFPEQYQGSYDAGLIHGAYHFAIPDNSTGAAQADFFVANGGGWSSDGRTLPGMLDLENNPYGPRCYGLTSAQMVAWVQSFDTEYQALTGRYPLLYTNADFWDVCAGGSSLVAKDPLDVAAWSDSPTPLPAGWSTYAMWQYTDANAIGFDGDQYDGSAAALETFVLGTGLTVPVTTTTSTSTSTTLPATASSGASGVSGTSGLSGAAGLSGTSGTTPTTTAPSTTTTTAPPVTTPTLPPGVLGPTLPTGQDLVFGQRLLSANGRYEVLMQPDGNLVEYIVGGRALWQSGTAGHNDAFAAVRGSRLMVFSATGQLLFGTAGRGSAVSYAIVQDDANFVVYRKAGGAIWASRTAGR